TIHLTRHTGHCHDDTLILLDPPTGCSTHWIGESLRGRNQVRLLDIAFWHPGKACGKHVTQFRLQRWINVQCLAEQRADRFTGEVILSWSQTTRHNDQVGAFPGTL